MRPVERETHERRINGLLLDKPISPRLAAITCKAGRPQPVGAVFPEKNQ